MAIKTPSATIISGDDPVVAQTISTALSGPPIATNISQVDAIGNTTSSSITSVPRQPSLTDGRITFNNATNNTLLFAGADAVSVINTDKDIYVTGIDQSTVQQFVYIDEPGGSNYQVQFNNGGDLDGVSSFSFNPNTKILSVDSIEVAQGATFTDVNKLSIGGGSTGQVLITDGSGNLSWGNTSGTGTVTSIGFSTGNTGLTVSSSSENPITSAGTFTLAGTLDTDNGGTGLSSIGGANSYLKVNALGTALEYAAIPTASVNVLGLVKIDGTTITIVDGIISAVGGGGDGGSGGGATNLDGLSDVVIITPSTGQVLKYNGSNWVNDTDSTGGSNYTLPAASTTVRGGVKVDGTTITINNDVISAAGFVPLTGGTMTGALSLSGNPTTALHAATKQYVDNLASGLVVKEAARTATASNITATYNNGTAGTGATLTGSGALGSINGVTLSLGDRILVKNQTTQTQNGMYELTTLNPFVLTRVSDFNSSSTINSGDAFFVGEGTLATTQWVMTTSGTITPGTTNIVFTQFGGPNSLTAGTGISITNNAIANTGVLSVTGGGGVTASTTNGAVTLGFTQSTVPTTAGGTGLTSIGAALQVLRVNSAANGLEWASVSSGGGSGDVVGPASATDNAIARFDSNTGKLIQNSLVTISDTGLITAPAVGSVIPFYFTNQAAFPNATTYQGALAVSNADTRPYFAQGGTWNAIAKLTDVVANTDTTYSISAADVSGQATKKNITLTAGGSGTGSTSVTLVAGTNVTLTKGTGGAANEITIAASGGGGGGSGTVTSVSLTMPTGFTVTGSPVTASGTLAVTTALTGLLKGNGSGFVAASAGSDYQAPITLTTTGTSGAATFTNGTLNIPQYSGGSGGGATNLDGLSDVVITTPSTGQVLKYNGSNWVNDTDSTGSGNLDGLSDVVITTPSTGQVLKYNGSNWVNDTDSTGSGGGGGTSAPEIVVFKYTTGSGGNLTGGDSKVSQTSGVSATITDGANAIVNYAFTGKNNPPKSITTYAQVCAANGNTQRFVIKDVTSLPTVNLDGGTDLANPTFIANIATSVFNSTITLQHRMSDAGASAGIGQRAHLVVVFGF